ncbi:MAG: ligand-binding sensor domain-containing protein [Bacteroidia bacterium]
MPKFFIYILFPTLLFSCNDQVASKKDEPKNLVNTSTIQADTTKQTPRNIRVVFEDSKGVYWFGSEGEGVFRYDGKLFTQYTQKDGLCHHQIHTIQEDAKGNLWFGTGNGIARFDGKNFSTFPNAELAETTSKDKKWSNDPSDLWFKMASGAYVFNGQSFQYLPLPSTPQDSNRAQTATSPLNQFAVYEIMKDRAGNIWFGTQSLGVCRYDGKTFRWFSDDGLGGPAVRALFEDKNGMIWFGNNGGGLFRYDGKTVTNFTREKGLNNDAFFKTGASGPHTLARVWSINEDKNGVLWVATIDAGVWRYDGKNLINFTTLEGLPSNTVNTIYKDKKGELWFGTEKGVCKFNGTSFVRFSIL